MLTEADSFLLHDSGYTLVTISKKLIVEQKKFFEKIKNSPTYSNLPN